MRAPLSTFISLTFCTSGLLLGAGCATLSHDARSQAVWVRSEPTGADIKIHGDVVGQTPLYVLVPRQREPKLVLSRDGVEKPVFLDTHYRWRDSFLGNLAFYIFAPVGWMTDLFTGSAWNPQDPPVISFRGADDARRSYLPDPDSAAIAPPVADSLLLSEAALPILQKAIETREKKIGETYSLLPYESTLPLFLKHGFDFDGRGAYDDQRMLFEKLDADAVWSSKLTSSDEGLHLDADLEDKRSRQKIDELHLLLETPKGFMGTYERGRHIFGLPNAVTVALSSQTFAVDRAPYPAVSLRPADNLEWWKEGLSYLSAISITNIPTYRAGRSGRWQFSLFPVLRVSHRDFVARNAPDVDGQTYSRWLVAVGYGPELGFQVHRSYFYVNLLFNEAWTQLSWRYRDRDELETRMSMLVSGELGYLYSLSSTWSLRFFINGSGENSDVWRSAIARTSTTGVPVNSQSSDIANIATFGIAVGYSFESFLVREFHEKEKTQRLEPLRVIPLSQR